MDNISEVALNTNNSGHSQENAFLRIPGSK